MKAARLLIGLLLFGSSLYLIAQSVTPASTEKPPVQGDELKFVVALFRHGVRSPTTEFQPSKADDSSKDNWPNEPPDWNVMPQDHDCDQDYPWGYLTQHGQKIAEGLGTYYATFYAKSWGDRFKVYLWADGGNQRTRATAHALADGFKVSGLPDANVIVESLPNCQPDPLFHPFQSKCGNPDPARLNKFVSEINANWKTWATNKYRQEFGQLYKLLACFNTNDCKAPLPQATATATPCPSPAAACKSPVKWTGLFSYASSASEALLLEYANAMQNVGWGRVDPPPGREVVSRLRDMLKLHEFYFDKTDRYIDDAGKVDYELASVDGSNLVREIHDQLTRKAGGDTLGRCRHAREENDFVGLVGHDTNIAIVAALLDLRWQFDDPNLPADTRDLPANDALPAGALVFELRDRGAAGYWVRIQYVTQSLKDMREGPVTTAFRLVVTGDLCRQKTPCEMPLADFQKRVASRINAKYLSGCTVGFQTCPGKLVPPTP